MIDLIEEHYRKNFTTIVKRMSWRAGSIADAEDVLQEAYLRAIKYRTTFDSEQQFDMWFSRIISNALKDYKRAQRELNGIDEADEELGETIDDYHLPEGVRREIRAVIEALNPEHREIVTLHHIYGYDLRQIVQIVDVKYKNADLIIQRFKKSLKEKYEELR